jgi:hypothetical protein
MAPTDTMVPVQLGFLPPGLAIDDPDHPGLRRAGDRATAPYGGSSVEVHTCEATDLAAPGAPAPDLLELGFDLADLSGLAELQAACARIRAAGRIDDDDAATIRAALDGAVLPLAGGRRVKVQYLADEGFIMRTGGPGGISLVAPQSDGSNDHGVATSVHADQDVYGTPLTQLMDGRAPSLLRHHSPDGSNDDARLLLVNLWIPLQQVVQPLVLLDGRSLDRRRHQLRYGLPTGSFLDRDDELAINDIWTFLHDPGQRWYFRSQLDHTSAYVFDTLSTAHGAGTLPGEDVAARAYRALEVAEAVAAGGDADAVRDAVAGAHPLELPADATDALRDAVAAMASVLDEAERDPAGICGAGAARWTAASRAARRGVVRLSLELRLVVTLVDESQP